jgi:hypothetical protein
MADSSRGDIPRSGDVILRRTNNGSRRFTLSLSGGAPQIACATYKEAVARAERFSHSEHVDVWQTDDGHAFTRIFEHRVAKSA